MNGNNFVQANEPFGILPIPDTTRTRIGLLPYHAVQSRETRARHDWLASKQGTRFVVGPIYTKTERILFKMMMNTGLSKEKPNWHTFASQWASHANGQDIFYKVNIYQHTRTV